MIVTATYMEHEGGTKFYEIVEFTDATAKRNCVVRRWGKIELAKRGEGQIKIEKFDDVRRLHTATKSIRQDKERRGYVAYVAYGGGFGLHRFTNTNAKLTAKDVLDHYSGREFGEEIVQYMGFPDAGVDQEVADDVVVIEEPVVIERGEEWGSW